MARRAGFAISADEEALRCALEHVWSEITSPRGLRARVQQLAPSVRTAGDGGAKQEGTNGADADGANGGNGASASWWAHSEIVDDLKEVSITYLLAFYK